MTLLIKTSTSHFFLINLTNTFIDLDRFIFNNFFISNFFFLSRVTYFEFEVEVHVTLDVSLKIYVADMTYMLRPKEPQIGTVHGQC